VTGTADVPVLWRARTLPAIPQRLWTLLQVGVATRRRLDTALASLAEVVDGWRESDR